MQMARRRPQFMRLSAGDVMRRPPTFRCARKSSCSKVSIYRRNSSLVVWSGAEPVFAANFGSRSMVYNHHYFYYHDDVVSRFISESNRCTRSHLHRARKVTRQITDRLPASQPAEVEPEPEADPKLCPEERASIVQPNAERTISWRQEQSRGRKRLQFVLSSF